MKTMIRVPLLAGLAMLGLAAMPSPAMAVHHTSKEDYCNKHQGQSAKTADSACDKGGAHKSTKSETATGNAPMPRKNADRHMNPAGQ